MSGADEEPWQAVQRDATTPDRLTFLDARGVSWQVNERRCVAVPGARGASCLIFDSGDVIRRVWEFPAHWRTLSAIALSELSWQR
jgi:hypothetical protein